MRVSLLSLAGIILFLNAADVYAQVYTSLSNNSNLACVNPPSGKTQIAIKKENGFANTTFKKAKKATANKISAERKKIQDASDIIKKLNAGKKKGLSSFDPSSKDFKAVSKFIFGKGNGNLSELAPTINEQIEMVEAMKSSFAANILFHQQIIQKIKDCENNKLPAVGALVLRFEALYKGPATEYTDQFGIVQPVAAPGIIALFAVVPEGALSPVFQQICMLTNTRGVGGAFPEIIPSHRLCLGLSDWPGACDHLVSEVESSKGASKFELAFIDELRFDWHPNRKTNPCTFEVCAAQAEAKLRAKWGDSISYISGAASTSQCTSLKANL